MTTSTEANKRAETSLARDWLNFAAYHLRPYLGGRRGLLLLSVAALGVGAVLSWDWLVAVGLAPLIVAVAPCAVMCALGLCMSRMGGQSCSAQSPAAREDADASSSRPAVGGDIPVIPQAAASDLETDAAADQRVGDDENQTAASTRSEATSERSRTP